MTKVVRIHETGGPEVLRLEELALAPPAAGEARVRIQAIGLNRSEALFRQGGYIAPPAFPALIGYEASGVVEALGEGVAGLAPGDRVSVLPSFRQGPHGVYAEAANVPAGSLLKVPAFLDPIKAAASWMQYLTAFAVVEVGKVGPGDFVIIPAASSSVGLAAIQLVNAEGGTPIAATRRSAKAAALRALGAAHVVATEEEDLVKEVMAITGGKGARLVFDPVGGPYVATLADAMAEEGILFIYGSLSNQPTQFPHWPACFKGLSLRGWVASQIWNRPERMARATAYILDGIEQGRLDPVIARSFPLDEIAEAHRFLESNRQVGKIVVTV